MDYTPPDVTADNVIRRLCIKGDGLASYEDAVLDGNDSGSEASMDMSE